MRSLSLLRHAKSSWADPGARDFDRPLNRRGREAAAAIGRALRMLDVAFDRVLSSPAARAVETIDSVARAYGGAFDPQEDERLYLAPSATLLRVVRETDDAVARLLIVGHNPGFEQFAAALTDGDDNPLRETMAEKFPTGALAEIAFDVDSWKGVAPGTGRLVRFIRPRDLQC